MGVTLLTGSNTGFGMLAALEFTRRGDTVYASMRDVSRADRLLEAAEREGLSLRIRELDVTDAASIDATVRAIADTEGRVDVLVNNAGVGRVAPVEWASEEYLRTVFETNFFGPVRLIRAVLPGMRAARRGTIVNVGSVAGRAPGFPANGLYGASKHALGALSDALSIEVRSFGIRVKVIEPGFFKTGMLERSRTEPDPSSPYADLEARVRLALDATMATGGGDPQRVAEAIADAAREDDDRVHIPVGADAIAAIQASRERSEAEIRNARLQALGLT